MCVGLFVSHSGSKGCGWFCMKMFVRGRAWLNLEVMKFWSWSGFRSGPPFFLNCRDVRLICNVFWQTTEGALTLNSVPLYRISMHTVWPVDWCWTKNMVMIFTLRPQTLSPAAATVSALRRMTAVYKCVQTWKLVCQPVITGSEVHWLWLSLAVWY